MQNPDQRPGVAIIANSRTPYREFLHLRLVRELPEIKLHCLYTHDVSNAAWSIVPAPETNPVSFGKGQPSAQQANPRYALREWKKAGQIIRWLIRENIKAVVMLGYNDPGRLRIIHWCKTHRVPCFLNGDSNIKGDLTVGFKAALKKILVTRVVKSCAGVMPCGSLGRDYFLKYGADPQKVYYFPYEPDYQMIRDIPQDEIAQSLAKFNLNPNRRRIVFSGRMIPIKHPEMAIKAFQTIATHRPDWDLLLIGAGPLLDDMKSLASNTPNIAFTGFIDNQRLVSALYRGSDLLVHPSEFEPWGLVINEAAAANLAMVVTDVVGAAAELVRDGVNGRLFKPNDQAALNAALLEVSSPERIDLMKSANIPILNDSRQSGDPVAGLRKALKDFNVL